MKKINTKILILLTAIASLFFVAKFNTINVSAQSIGSLKYTFDFKTYQYDDRIHIYYEGEDGFTIEFGSGEELNEVRDIKIEGNLKYTFDFKNYEHESSLHIYDEGEDGFTIEFASGEELNEARDIYIVGIPGDKRPAISGNEHFATNVDTPKPVDFFISHLSAIDDIDGDISDDIYVVEDNYTDNEKKVGEYEVVVGVKDSSENETTFTFIVHVADITPPKISGDTSIAKISYDKTYDIEAFKKTLVVTDNYDTDVEIKIESDIYSKSKTKIGIYDVVFSATDKSGNRAQFTKKIQVIDGVKPVFNGIKDLVKSYTNIMSVNDIIKDIKATDAIDGDLSDSIKIESDEYTGKANIPGKYKIVLSVSDKSGNKETHTINVKVIDDKAPNWYITNGVTLNLAPDATLSRQQIVDLLSRSGQVKASANSIVTYVSDTYSDNIGNPGIYRLAFNVKEPNGNTNDYTYAINVLAQEDNDQDVIPTPPKITDKVKTWFSDNKATIITVSIGLIALVFISSKVKEQIRKNKRKRR